MVSRITRRSLAIGAPLLIGLGARAMTDADVVVVGAGAAGIAACRSLRRQGRTAILLEARDRIGGRVHTDGRLGIPFDAGAEYIHWGERNPWTGIAREAGVPLQEDTGGNPPLLYANGLVIPAGERSGRSRAFARLDDLIAAGTHPDRSIAEAVSGAGPEATSAAAGLTRLTLGEEPERVSAADYDGLWSGDDYVMPSGYGDLVARHGAGLDARLNTPARRIDWSGPGIKVETDAGTLQARAAIVTVPVGVVQAGGIGFAPGLPDDTRAAFEGLAMGAYTKIALRIDRAGLGPGDFADSIDMAPRGATISFEAWPYGRDLIIAYLGGDFARALCQAGEREAVDYATERLVAIAGSRFRPAVAGGVLAGWWTDPWSRGGYSIAKPAHAGAREALRRPLGDRVWFAGEASAGGGAMTAGGAYLEGVRAAEAVVRMLPA